MNAFDLAQSAYGATTAPIRTDRGTEYEAFARVTRALNACATGRTPEFPARVRALHENRRLWTLLAGAVSDAGNQLPADLRARILYLAEFTQLHSAKILRGEDDIAVLVDINTAVMAGLRGPAPSEEARST